MKSPLVSVLMTVYNSEKYLKSSIKSILKQSFKKWELVIVDDFSTDKSRKILRKIKNNKIKVFLLNKHIGRTNALNYGLKKTKGKYIAILDSDDMSCANRFYVQHKFLNENKKINMIAARVRLIDENGKTVGFHPSIKEIKDFNKIIFYKNIIAHSSVMFRKDFLKKTGIYPKNLKWAQDYGLILKFYKTGKLFFTPKVLAICRVLKTSMTYRKEYKLTRVKEQISLLFFSLNNFKLNTFQKYKIFVRMIINNIKFFLIQIFGI